MAKFVHVPFDRAMGILAPLRPGKRRTMDRLNLADNATAEGHQTGTIRYNIHSKFDLLKVSTFLQSVTLFRLVEICSYTYKNQISNKTELATRNTRLE